MKNLFPLIILLFLFSSCGKDAQMVEYTFYKIITEQEWNEEKAEQYFAEHSLNYLKKLATISETSNYPAAEKLGFEYGAQLITMRMHGELNNYVEVMTSEDVDLTIQNVLTLMQFSGTGVVGMALQNRIGFREVSIISNEEAQAEVTIATGNKAKIISNYIFEKEGEDWKINLISTLTMQEKVLKQNLRRSPFRHDKAAFIMNHLASAPQEMQFQYRSR